MGAAGAFMLANNSTVPAPANLSSLTVIFDAIMGVNIGMFYQILQYCIRCYDWSLHNENALYCAGSCGIE